MKKVLTSLFTLCAVLLLPTLVFGQGRIDKLPAAKAVKHDTSRPLREITPVKGGASRTDFEPKRPAEPGGEFNDPVVQSSAVPLVAITAGLNFEGVGEGLPGYNANVAPPDTTGDVGATQYVQWVNSHFAVFDKVSGAMTYGPAAGNTLWAGFGGACQTRNDGDPIVQYDQIANRWVMTQFAVPGGAAGYWQCVAVSTTSDATGSYNRYAFQYDQFPDYPKVGVWPDAYYVTFNMFTNFFTGARVCAWDRAAMIAGTAATQQCFQLSTSYGSLLPADMDGPVLPPTGSPNYMLNFTTNALRMWKFSVNWTNPAASTLTGPTSIPVAAFTRGCDGGACVEQPGTNQKLDSLGDRLMYRLAYRNFGTHQNLVVNHSVRTGQNRKTYRTGIRWYELRNLSAATPTVHQQGTYAPDTTNYRWMGSAAMDKVGNLAVGYSVSSSSLRPSIRFAARASSDPLGTLSTESNVLTGTGSQTQGLARWGDYATISIDPVDDCTMWFTTEYIATNGTWNWHTRINSFKLQGCQ
ncbi:MAG TPA: hypothetical protein VF240_03385 [Pyrinomonadaceae bacterium]